MNDPKHCTSTTGMLRQALIAAHCAQIRQQRCMLVNDLGATLEEADRVTFHTPVSFIGRGGLRGRPRGTPVFIDQYVHESCPFADYGALLEEIERR